MKNYIFPNTFDEKYYGASRGFYEYLAGYLREEKEYLHTEAADVPCRIILLVNGEQLEGELFVSERNDYGQQKVEGKYRYGYMIKAIWKYKYPVSLTEFREASGYDKVVKNYRASIEDNEYFILQTMIDPVKLL